MMAAEVRDTVTVHGGNIYLPAAIYERFFAKLDSVALLEREQALVIMPLRQPGGGGLLLKILNARGDRVIHAREVLAAMDIDEDQRHEVSARWDAKLAGLKLEITEGG